MMEMRRNRKTPKRERRFDNGDDRFNPERIEIVVDGDGTAWFVSSAPIFEKEKGVKHVLCG